MSYEDRASSGTYKGDTRSGPYTRRRPSPGVMDAETLVGSDACDQESEDPSEIEEIVLDLYSGTNPRYSDEARV